MKLLLPCCPLHHHTHCEEGELGAAGQVVRLQHFTAGKQDRAAPSRSRAIESEAAYTTSFMTSQTALAAQQPQPRPGLPEVGAEHDAGRAGEGGKVAQRGAQQAHAVCRQGALPEFVDDAECPAEGAWRARHAQHGRG